MAKESSGKRPCCICRKWFKPDVRQKKRQQTCGRPDCKRERHRRQCEKWNKKNKDYPKSNYLDKKIAAVQEILPDEPPITNTRQIPILPHETIINDYRTKVQVLPNYLKHEIFDYSRVMIYQN